MPGAIDENERDYEMEWSHSLPLWDHFRPGFLPEGDRPDLGLDVSLLAEMQPKPSQTRG